MFTIYAIYNREADKLYIGQTERIEERLQMHNSHQIPKSYTARFLGKWILIYSEQANTREDALKREKQLKSYQGRLFVRKHIPR